MLSQPPPPPPEDSGSQNTRRRARRVGTWRGGVVAADGGAGRGVDGAGRRRGVGRARRRRGAPGGAVGVGWALHAGRACSAAARGVVSARGFSSRRRACAPEMCAPEIHPSRRAPAHARAFWAGGATWGRDVVPGDGGAVRRRGGPGGGGGLGRARGRGGAGGGAVGVGRALRASVPCARRRRRKSRIQGPGRRAAAPRQKRNGGQARGCGALLRLRGETPLPLPVFCVCCLLRCRRPASQRRPRRAHPACRQSSPGRRRSPPRRWRRPERPCETGTASGGSFRRGSRSCWYRADRPSLPRCRGARVTFGASRGEKGAEH